MDYEALLKRAKENIPESALKTERFTIPKVKGHIQGNKTIIANIFQIADYLQRDPDHMLKFLFKELGTPGETRKPRVIFGRKVSASQINKRIRDYARKYVICKECGKPDTSLKRQNRILFVKCKACGAKYAAG